MIQDRNIQVILQLPKKEIALAIRNIQIILQLPKKEITLATLATIPEVLPPATL